MDNNLILQEKEYGNILFKKNEFKNAIDVWLSVLNKCNTDKIKKIIYSNISLANICLKNYDKTIFYCNEANKLNYNDEIIDKKIKYREKIAHTENSIINNSKILITENYPSKFNENMLELFKEKKYLHIPINGYTSTKIKNYRFYGVMGILTCISAFIISKNMIFICHIPISFLHYVNDNKDILTNILKKNNEKWEKIYLIGGHKSQDLIFHNISFSNTIINIFRTILPDIELDTSKLNIFNGCKINTFSDEITLRKKNTRFISVIYDTYHNKIITHTEYITENLIFTSFKNIQEYEIKQYKKLNFSGQLLKKMSYEL
jgi:hypothetical protein